MLDKKKILRLVSLGMSTVVLAGAGLLSGCTAPSDHVKPDTGSTPPVAQQSKEDKIMPEFFSLVRENPKPDRLIGFMEMNIGAVSRESASKMLLELERSQQNYLSQLEERYYSETSVQEEISKLYSKAFDLNALDNIEDEEIMKLLNETRDMGYRLETAEGIFFPIIDYEYLKKFSSYAGDDIREYVNLMSVESSRVPAKDAALMIEWDEVVNRALAQEAYLNKYGTSAKAEAIMELQKKYIMFMLFGLNNTPLFSYGDRTMDREARLAYISAVKENEGSELMKLLGEYMELAEKSDYKLSEQLDGFRKAAVDDN